MSGDFESWDPTPRSTDRLPKESERGFAAAAAREARRKRVKRIAFWLMILTAFIVAFAVLGHVG